MNTIRRESAIPLASSFAAICLGSLTMSMFAHDAAAGTLVVVPPGLEAVEGNNQVFTTAHTPETVMMQEVFPASEFLDVPANHNTIVAVRMRPDYTRQGPWVTNLTYEVRLSTTDAVPDTLDPVFDNNRGDDYVVVYRGPTQFSTDGAGPFWGPRNFDYIVEFQEPFEYDPSSGRSLLYEEYVSQSDNGAYFDSHNSGQGIRRQGALWTTDGGEPALEAQPPFFQTAIVRQFEFVSAPSGDIDGDGDVDGFDFIAWQQNPSTGNLSDWQANYGLPITASSATVPAPASITLVLVFVGLSTARRHR